MGLDAVVIDTDTLEGASEARRLEWSGIIREMTTPGEMALRADARTLRATLTQQGTLLQLEDEEGHGLAEVTLAHDLLTELVTEYVDVVREIARASKSGGVGRLEALDIAKKATHDRAGQVLERRLRSFEIDHPSARRVFTLLLALKVDTTRLVGVHAHRRIR